jgi:hypothetical protein
MSCATGLLEISRSQQYVHGPRLLQRNKKENGAENDGNRRQGIEETGDDRRTKKRKRSAKIAEPHGESEGGRQGKSHRCGQRIRFRHHHDEKHNRQRGKKEIHNVAEEGC